MSGVGGAGAVFWCERAWLPDGVAERVLVCCSSDGVVRSVRAGVCAPSGATRLGGLVFPGFANAHSHAFHRALRGRTHAGGGTFWTWRDGMYRLAGALDPDRYYRLARLVYAEMLLAGYTAVGEFHYLHHPPDGGRYRDPNAMGLALVEAARDAGIRLTLLDACYLAGGLDTTGYRPLDRTQARFGDQDVGDWLSRLSALVSAVPGGAAGPESVPLNAVTGSESVPLNAVAARIRVGAAVHSVRAVPADALPTIAKFDPRLPLHLHLSEQPAENQACRAYHRCTPTELLAGAGLLRASTTAVHATHLTRTDIELLGVAGVTACFCPSTEADLADGIGPARELADAGCPISLGSDQHAVIDALGEARALEHGERLRTGRRGRFGPAELVRAGTTHGYDALGWPGGGQLVAGAPADLTAVHTETIRTAGARPEQLIMAATAADVHTVVVGGELVVSQGRHRTIGDVGAEMAGVIEELCRT
ncbi:MAG TPA: formimidoylglutamate deiminase [Pseudonocardia sp.]|jgi:cytosine/adenosine deaminase-related metal-dependent hydrolase